jgi:MATE family multidrug resistance protein
MNKKILQLAIPNIISNITIPLVGLADMAVTGRLESDVYIGAIALGAMIFNLIYWTFGFLRMGASGITAQAYGAKNKPEIAATLIRGLLVGGIGALLILLLQIPIAKTAFYFIDGSQEVENFARSYYYIRIWAAPATISLYAFTGWFIGMQNTKIPMLIAIVVNLLNVGLNVLFVFTFQMKSDGVALGTVISQYVGLAMALLFIRFKYHEYFSFIKIKTLIDSTALKNFFKVNRDIFIRTMSLLAVFTFFTSKSASANDQILAANSLLLQFLFIFSFLTDGFAYAAEALSGKYFGARQFGKLRQSIIINFKWGAVITLVFTLIYWFGSESILRLLTNHAEVLDEASKYTFWVTLIPIVSVASFLWDGVFIGITATSKMRNSMLIAVFLVFFPTWYLLAPHYANHALWLAFILFLLTRGLTQTIMFKNMSSKLFSDYQ